ncbi:3'-5' exonuclease [Vibrio sp. D404a]|uniref:3'-5' exonuclease n=1 Tax=unclassified Vibrio TaxID=2614977 RepID=UPI0025560233|nr:MULTISPECIES: 3'-5' exonuclease [unclassified Vibrio]MDK9739305.1 3'-5' exonuclease [Vibrio sp. D404a]MDK9797659.1 3'-5' exonuclease [Vibrio sp. D449a]
MIVTVLDTETTGIDVEQDKIIELAMSVYRKEEGGFRQVGKTWNPLIWTPRKIDPKAYAVHHISEKDLEGKPSFSEIAPRLIKILEKSDFVVAHNGHAFDLPMIVFNLMADGFDVPQNFHAIDTMVDGRTTTALGKVPNLQEFCWSMGVDYNPDLAHRADYDTEVLAQAFFKALDFGYLELKAS